MQLVLDMCRQLGFHIVFERIEGVLFVDIGQPYIHYDELEPFTKLNYFKAVSISEDGHRLVLQFII